jgi:hypothetical protein
MWFLKAVFDSCALEGSDEKFHKYSCTFPQIRSVNLKDYLTFHVVEAIKRKIWLQTLPKKLLLFHYKRAWFVSDAN